MELATATAGVASPAPGRGRLSSGPQTHWPIPCFHTKSPDCNWPEAANCFSCSEETGPCCWPCFNFRTIDWTSWVHLLAVRNKGEESVSLRGRSTPKPVIAAVCDDAVPSVSKRKGERRNRACSHNPDQGARKRNPTRHSPYGECGPGDCLSVQEPLGPSGRFVRSNYLTFTRQSNCVIRPLFGRQVPSSGRISLPSNRSQRPF